MVAIASEGVRENGNETKPPIPYRLFFFDNFERCFFAAFMLSTRLGYFRPAFFAAAFALALLFAVNLVCLLFFGAGLFQGAFCVFFFVGIMESSLGGR